MRDIEFYLENDDAYVEGGHALLFLQGMASAPGERTFIVTRNDRTTPYLSESGWQAKAAAEGLAKPVTKDGGDLVVRLDPSLTRHFKPFEVYTFEFRGLGVRGTVSWDGIDPFTGDYEALQAETGEVKFTLLPSGQVRVEGHVDKGSSREVLARDFEPGEPVLGVAYSEVKAARAGKIAFDRTAGTGEIIERASAQPGTARFATGEDGTVSVEGHYDSPTGRIPVQQTLSAGENFYLASHADLARNVSGKLIFDAGTGEVSIQADMPETPPPVTPPVTPPPVQTPPVVPGPTTGPGGKEEPRKKSPLLLILSIAGVLLLALIAGGAYFFLMSDDGSGPSSDPQVLLADAQQMEADGECDAAAQRYDDAVRAGSGAAAIAIADAYKPGPDFDGCITTRPDTITALRYVQNACQLGEKERGREIIVEIKTDLEGRIDGGDARAQRVLDLQVPAAESACAEEE